MMDIENNLVMLLSPYIFYHLVIDQRLVSQQINHWKNFQTVSSIFSISKYPPIFLEQ
jgi:hypothetical protein